MSSNRVYPVILCGGAGNRLWPVSRSSYPKQFSEIIDDSLLGKAIERINSANYYTPTVVTSDDYRFLVRDEFRRRGLSPMHILLEPTALNTGPAIAWSIVRIIKDDPDAVILVTPSDHVIDDVNKFDDMVTRACNFVDEFDVIVFGVKPTYPETQYGWISVDEDNFSGDLSAGKCVRVSEFVEKPSETVAKKLFNSEKAMWNSGIFLFRAKAVFNLYRDLFPEFIDTLSSMEFSVDEHLGFSRLSVNDWLTFSPFSFDKEILESTPNVGVVQFSGAWSDLGTWTSVWNYLKDPTSTLSVSTNAYAKDCEDVLLLSQEDAPLLVGLGLTGITAISTPDAVLVTTKDSASSIKCLVQEMRELSIPQSDSSHKDYRPWGWFEVLKISDTFQVKRLHVYPGAELSLQSHNFRSEHWVVVKGTAEVTVGDIVKKVSVNESVYIPVSCKHRLANKTSEELEIVEVQTGSYFGEDDIIRYDDIYNRNN